MKNTNVLVMLLLGGSILFGSCKDKDDDHTMDNQTFVTRASSSNQLEINAGNLAVQLGANAEVRHYGEHMVADHSTAGTELTALASRKGWQIATSLMQPHQQMINELSPLSGNAFDKAFARIMVQSHQEAVSLFEQASRDDGLPDRELREWAGGKLPTLKAHLEEARELNATINP
jgi:putative membrane protein